MATVTNFRMCTVCQVFLFFNFNASVGIHLQFETSSLVPSVNCASTDWFCSHMCRLSRLCDCRALIFCDQVIPSTEWAAAEAEESVEIKQTLDGDVTDRSKC